VLPWPLQTPTRMRANCLKSLVGKQLKTLTGRANEVLRLDGDVVIVFDCSLSSWDSSSYRVGSRCDGSLASYRRG